MCKPQDQRQSCWQKLLWKMKWWDDALGWGSRLGTACMESISCHTLKDKVSCWHHKKCQFLHYQPIQRLKRESIVTALSDGIFAFSMPTHSWHSIKAATWTREIFMFCSAYTDLASHSPGEQLDPHQIPGRWTSFRLWSVRWGRSSGWSGQNLSPHTLPVWTAHSGSSRLGR